MILSSDDIVTPSGGLFNHTRSYANDREAGAYADGVGYNWWIKQQPYIAAVNNQIVEVVFDRHERYWFKRSGPNFVPYYSFYNLTLVKNPDESFTMTDGRSQETIITEFHKLDPLDITSHGQMISRTDSRGTLRAYRTRQHTTELRRVTSDSSETQLESLFYDYFTDGPAIGQLESVTYSKYVTGGSYIPVTKVVYEYYGASDAHGSVNDLKSASRQVWSDASEWKTVAMEYYRYWLNADATGFAHGLKMHFGPEACRLIFNKPLSLASASDEDLKPYADHYFEYDPATWAVTKEVSAVCSSCVGGGTTADRFEFTPNDRNPANGYNVWKTKTIQKLPDSSTLTVYSNYASMPMLKVRADSTGTDRWATFFLYDDAGQVIWEAQPSAVALPPSLATLEGYDDLLHFNNTTKLFRYLSTSSGLIKVKSYHSFGNIESEYVREGQAGANVKVKSYTYTSNEYEGKIVSVVQTVAVYPVAGRDDKAIITRYDYPLWHARNQMKRRITTPPKIDTDQNGSGANVTIIEDFDEHGNLVQRTDERGIVNQYHYDVVMSVVTQQVLNYQNGVIEPGVNVTTDFTYDGRGRLVRTLGPAHEAVVDDVATSVRSATFTTYVESIKPDSGVWALDQTCTAQGYATGTGPAYTYAIVDPVSITRTFKDGRLSDQITSVRTYGSGALAAADSFAQVDWQTWVSTHYDEQHRTKSSRTYFLIPASGDGAAGTNYGESLYGYDALERRNRIQSPSGTITRTMWSTPQRVASIWVGTDDAGASDSDPSGGNMRIVTSNEYDNGSSGGDGHLTKVTQHVSGVATENRATSYGYDFRGRRINMTDATGRHTVYNYDNVDRQFKVQSYDLVDGTLFAQSETKYDDRSRPYQTLVYSVDPSTGTFGDALTGNTWYDKSGNVLQQIQPGDGQTFTKNSYNEAGWVTGSYRGINHSGTNLAQASTVAGDVILTQAISKYDETGNVISQATFDRFHDAPDIGAGSTGSLSAATNPKARVRYTASWYDGIGRSIATANFGAVAALTRLGTPPARSDTILVTSTSYDDAGRVHQTIDPKGIVTQVSYDDANRTAQKIEAYTGASPGTNHDRTTNFAYNPAGYLIEIAAINVSSTATTTQRTAYLYGVAQAADSKINSNDVLAAVRYPDKATGDASAAEQESYTVNRMGERISKTDRNGTVHQYRYDPLGRLTDDATGTLGLDIDGAVQRISTTYNVQGQPEMLTSYDAPVGGSVVNEVQRQYNGLGQIKTEFQAVAGAVSVVTTPKVQYGYSEIPSGTNHSRLESMTYPNGRILSYNYGATGSLNQALSRLASIWDSSATLETYQYLGLGTVVERGHPEPDLKLTYIGTGPGDGGDNYVGLDRFGRVVDQNWTQGTVGSVDRYAYGYDRNGNALWRANGVNGSFSELYGYDDLNRLTTMQRGTLNTTNTALTGPASRSQSWVLDALGNSDSVITDGTIEPRVHNDQNQLSMVGNVRQVFDKNGNLLLSSLAADFDHNGTVDFNDFIAFQTNYGKSGKAWSEGDSNGDGNVDFNDFITLQTQFGTSTPAATYTYDAWDRLVAATKDNAPTAYAYDASNRRIHRNAETVYFTTAWQEIQCSNSSDSTTISYVWSPVYIDAMITRDCSTNGSVGDRLYPMEDANWNVTAVTNASGIVQARYAYTAYGSRAVLNPAFAASVDTLNWQHGFQGGASEAASPNLILFRNRMLDIVTMRWLAQDPLGTALGAGLSLYQYIQSSPITLVDPLGLQATQPVKTKPGSFPSKLHPISIPDGSTQDTIPLKEALEKLGVNNPQKLIDDGRFKRGCIDLFEFLTGIAILSCFRTPQEADAFQCPKGFTSRMTGLRQGFYDPKKLDSAADGSITTRFENPFNYAIQQPDGSYIYMNYGEGGGKPGQKQEQKVRVNQEIPHLDDKSENMRWMTLHCIICGRQQ